MPAELYGVKSSEIHTKIKLLINALVNIKDETGQFLMTLEDGRVIDTKGWNDWEWTHGIGLYGIWQYFQLTGDEDCLRIIEDWFRDRFAAGGTTKNINTMAVFLTLSYVYEHTGNQTYRPWLESWAEWAYFELPKTKHNGFQHITYLEVNDQQLWCDTLQMCVLPLARCGIILNRPEYVAEAKRQFLLHIQYLFDRKSGLFFHGWTFQDGGHNFADARWCRANSWYCVSAPEFIELLNLGPEDPIGAILRSTLEAQCAALKPLQLENGLWRTLLDIPEDRGSYPEASGSAGFAFGILKAQRKRYIGKEYQDVAVKAVKGVLDNISPEGELLQTSFGTGMGMDLQHYLDIPVTPMPYGQAMAIMALVEYLRLYI